MYKGIWRVTLKLKMLVFIKFRNLVAFAVLLCLLHAVVKFILEVEAVMFGAFMTYFFLLISQSS